MMPSKKKKYNARFPAGRIKKIMQTDEEVGKVAQAVPVIISRALELFVQSLLTRATQITRQRNAKTLSPSHLKQCIQNEARFDFLRDLVKPIPDVSVAEEVEMQSGENSPNPAGCSEPLLQPVLQMQRKSDQPLPPPDISKRRTGDPHPVTQPVKRQKTETVTSGPIDLTIRPDQIRRPNFYQETLPDDEPSDQSVIKYANSQPSTSSVSVRPVQTDILPKIIQYPKNTSTSMMARAPVLNIDFTKDLRKPEFKVLDKALTVPPLIKIPQNYTVKALSRSAVNDKKESVRTSEIERISTNVTDEFDT